jgi:hypothetical protein
MKEALEWYNDEDGLFGHSEPCMDSWERYHELLVQKLGFTVQQADLAFGYTTELGKNPVDFNRRSKGELRELAAKRLRGELKKIRGTKFSPVRSHKTMSPLEIADTGTALLSMYVESIPLSNLTRDYPIENLLRLIEELLNVDRHRAKLATSAQYTDAFREAACADAAAGLEGKNIGVKKLAKRVSASPASILKWRKSQPYRRMMQIWLWEQQHPEFLEAVKVAAVR